MFTLTYRVTSPEAPDVNPQHAWLFTTFQEAEDFATMLTARYNDTLVYNITPAIVTPILGGKAKTAEELFEAWEATQDEDEAVNIDEASDNDSSEDAFNDLTESFNLEDRRTAVGEAYKEICPGCKGRADYHIHKELSELTEAEIAGEEEVWKIGKS